MSALTKRRYSALHIRAAKSGGEGALWKIHCALPNWLALAWGARLLLVGNNIQARLLIIFWGVLV